MKEGRFASHTRSFYDLEDVRCRSAGQGGRAGKATNRKNALQSAFTLLLIASPYGLSRRPAPHHRDLRGHRQIASGGPHLCFRRRGGADSQSAVPALLPAHSRAVLADSRLVSVSPYSASPRFRDELPGTGADTTGISPNTVHLSLGPLPELPFPVLTPAGGRVSCLRARIRMPPLSWRVTVARNELFPSGRRYGRRSAPRVPEPGSAVNLQWANFKTACVTRSEMKYTASSGSRRSVIPRSPESQLGLNGSGQRAGGIPGDRSRGTAPRERISPI